MGPGIAFSRTDPADSALSAGVSSFSWVSFVGVLIVKAVVFGIHVKSTACWKLSEGQEERLRAREKESKQINSDSRLVVNIFKK